MDEWVAQLHCLKNLLQHPAGLSSPPLHLTIMHGLGLDIYSSNTRLRSTGYGI